MKVTYLAHSGFEVEYKDSVLIFDYYKGEIPVLRLSERLKEERKVYVFASHSHEDHFNPCILQWAEELEHVMYILSDDIKGNVPDDVSDKSASNESASNESVSGRNITYVSPNHTYKIGGLSVRTLRSTDKGVAFLVHLEDKVIYHAGDLNWWHWKEESDVWNEFMRRKYPYEIGKLKEERIDAAFVPLDPNQEEAFSWGLDYFMRHTDTQYVFPMHMWEKYETWERLLELPEAAEYKEKVMHVRKPGQEFQVGADE